MQTRSVTSGNAGERKGLPAKSEQRRACGVFAFEYERMDLRNDRLCILRAPRSHLPLEFRVGACYRTECTDQDVMNLWEQNECRKFLVVKMHQ